MGVQSFLLSLFTAINKQSTRKCVLSPRHVLDSVLGMADTLTQKTKVIPTLMELPYQREQGLSTLDQRGEESRMERIR